MRTIKQLMDEATRREGGKISQNRAEVGEGIARFLDALAEDFYVNPGATLILIVKALMTRPKGR